MLGAAEPVAAGPVIDRLNADRAALGLKSLGADPRLTAVGQAVADEVTQAGTVDGVEIESEALAVRLRERGYRHRRFVIAYVVGAAESSLAEEWPAMDAESWRRMLDPLLRDVTLARGATSRGPFYLLLGAVSQDDAKAREAEALHDLEAVRRQVLELTNQYRASKNLIELGADGDLDRVAQRYADDMLRRGFYGHLSPEGADVMDRLRSERIRVRRAGENLAEGPPSTASVLESWYESPSHRRNLLHRSFRLMGLGLAVGEDPDGVYRIYWVQVFSSARRPIS